MSYVISVHPLHQNLSLPALAHLFDMALKLPDFFFFMVTGGLIYHIFNSFAANCARIGWEKWIPAWLLERGAFEIQANRGKYTLKKQLNYLVHY